MRRDSSSAERSKAEVERRRGSTNGIVTCCTAPHAWHSTRGMGKTMNVARLPMGTARKRRSTRPRDWTGDDSQAEQRQVVDAWWMVKITWPSWKSVRVSSSPRTPKA
jgi:hypothetical protein